MILCTISFAVGDFVGAWLGGFVLGLPFVFIPLVFSIFRVNTDSAGEIRGSL